MTDTANKVANKSDAIPRRRGPPPGTPKPLGSGRKKGSKNVRTREVAAVWDPIARRMGRKLEKRFNAELKKGDDCNLSFCLGFFKEASGYAWGKPASMIAGDPEGTPIEVEVEVLDDRELARQTALILYRGDPKRIIDRRKE